VPFCAKKIKKLKKYLKCVIIEAKRGEDVIYLVYAEIPEREIAASEIRDLFGKVLYLEPIEGIKNCVSRRESLSALLLLARTLRNMGLNPSEITVGKDKNGRPRIEGEGRIDFSISHSGRFVACAVSDEERVGVDIEKISRDSNYLKIADRFLSEAERKEVKNADDFARMWTRKEAYYKYLGSGESLAVTDSGSADGVYIESFLIENEYFLSVCSETKKYMDRTFQKDEIK